MYQFFCVKFYSTNQHGNLRLLDDPGRVRSKTTSVVCQIQRFVGRRAEVPRDAEGGRKANAKLRQALSGPREASQCSTMVWLLCARSNSPCATAHGLGLKNKKVRLAAAG
jgi:hypothetical protein